MLAVQETLILCGLAGFCCEYVPVFLAGKNVNLFEELKRGAKICRYQSCAPE